jgi:MutS-like protein
LDIQVSPAHNGPAEEYTRRLAERHAEVRRLDAVDDRFVAARAVTVVGGVAMAVLAWRGSTTRYLVFVPLVVFGFLVAYHDRIFQARALVKRAIAFYDRGLLRLADSWIGKGEPGDRFRDDEHLYANDLDLFGRGSLFELLSLARTRPGEATLARWLKEPAPAPEILIRQNAVRELTPLLDLREALSLAGDDVRASVDGERLVAWAEGPRVLGPPWMRFVTLFLTMATVTAIVWLLTAGDPLPLELAIFVQILVHWARRGPIQRTLHGADGPARNLDVLSHILEVLEKQTFSSPRLCDLRHRIEADGCAASTAIRRLHRLMEWHDWEHNLIFTPIAATLQWGTHLAWAIEAWRARYGGQVRRWIEAVAEVEALASLAAYHFEHPGDPFPEIVDGPATFDASRLGHPLLPAARMVANDVRLVGETRLLVVSGSNMSGKSTLLRTVGVTAVLAFAGAPVRAARLRVTPLAIGATLRIQDSLQEGRSRFYAEITRIRRLSDVARGTPHLLFLLDELFHGTNSHDRLVGASGVLRRFVEQGAIGLVTTHDLAMTRVVDELAPRAVNVHFDDWFAEDELRFDYAVKSGPVTRSNAIALMRAVGLDVEEPQT